MYYYFATWSLTFPTVLHLCLPIPVTLLLSVPNTYPHTPHTERKKKVTWEKSMIKEICYAWSFFHVYLGLYDSLCLIISSLKPSMWIQLRLWGPLWFPSSSPELAALTLPLHTTFFYTSAITVPLTLCPSPHLASYLIGVSPKPGTLLGHGEQRMNSIAWMKAYRSLYSIYY